MAETRPVLEIKDLKDPVGAGRVLTTFFLLRRKDEYNECSKCKLKKT